jgi:hypothetical protein
MHGDIHADMPVQPKTEYPLGLHIGLPCSPCSVMTHLDMLSRRVSSAYFQNFFKGRGVPGQDQASPGRQTHSSLNPNPKSRKTWILYLSHRSNQGEGDQNMNSDMKCPLQPISKTSSKGMGARSGPPRRGLNPNPNPRSRKTWILHLSHRSKQARGRRKTRTWIQIWYALRETAWDSRKKEGMKNHEWFRSGGVKKEGWRRTNSLVTTVFTDLVPELDVSACIKSSFGTTHYHSRGGGHVDLHLWLKRAVQIPQQRIKSLPTSRQRSGLRILITEEAQEHKCRNHSDKCPWKAP